MRGCNDNGGARGAVGGLMAGVDRSGLGGKIRLRNQDVKDCCIWRKEEGGGGVKGGLGGAVANDAEEGVERGIRVKPPNVQRG